MFSLSSHAAGRTYIQTSTNLVYVICSKTGQVIKLPISALPNDYGQVLAFVNAKVATAATSAEFRLIADILDLDADSANQGP